MGAADERIEIKWVGELTDAARPLVEPDFSSGRRADAIAALSASAGVSSAHRSRTTGAIIPLIHSRSADGTRRGLRLVPLVIVAVDRRTVAVSHGHPQDLGPPYDVAPKGVDAPAPAPGASAGSVEDPVTDRLPKPVLATIRSLPTADHAAAALARYVAEFVTRDAIETVLHDDLAQLEAHAAASARPAAADHESSTDLGALRSVPLQIQRLRSQLAAALGALDTADRGRVDTWKLGGVPFRDLDPAITTTDRRIDDLQGAHRHIQASAELARRARAEAIDALATSTAASTALVALATERTQESAQSFEVAVTTLTAALAGPGLLFALWALDVFGSPIWATAVAAAVTGLVLVAVLWFLHREAGKKLRWEHALGYGAAVTVLVLAAMLVPGVSDPAPDERARETLLQLRELDRRQSAQSAEQTAQLEAIVDELRLLRTGGN